MPVNTRNILILMFGLFLGVLLALGQSVFADKNVNSAYQGIPLDDIRTLSEVFGKIKENYVEKIDDKTLLTNAIRGMLSGLDPHSSFLDLEEFKELTVGTRGEFGGLGIVVGMENGFVKVISPIDDTPAQRAGIQAGDLIIRLDKKPVKGMELDEAVKLMRGKPGEPIDLLVSREGVDKPFKVTVVRDKIRVKSIKHRVLEPGYGYVRITQFQERTGEDLLKALDALKKKNKKAGFNGLVLDLRNNPGGLLDAAVAVSDAFLTEGIIVSVRGRHRDSQHSFQATPIDRINGIPLVVLVNGGSASASEIVAGALQDHKRAVIMGRQTFGKGSVQSIVKLGNNTALKMTTARYYTPNDRTIQAKGITPDIKISHVEVAVKEGGSQYVKEADLKGHLMNDKNPDVEMKGKSDKKKKADKKEKPLASKDYPLYEALNLLKGLHLLSGMK
ncbi:Carboxyl-terminal protease [hydrothermal vent metagenome]|uniref:Carboxyl-terminal protease n=1 Tax=hydrothermal vent metagenome TaxID=652676 RepID=A0A3B0ZGF8_9ZZZZ